MEFDLNGVRASLGTFFGGNGASGVGETGEEDVSVWEDYDKTDSSDVKNQNEEEGSFFENTLDSIVEKNPEAQGLVENFKGFLENLFAAVKEQFGIEWSFDTFTEETLSDSSNKDGMESGTIDLMKTFISAFGVKIGDNSSEKTSKKV